MPKLTRIYTRTGDDGSTGLVGGGRVQKNDLRIEAYGTIDELCSFIGLARASIAGLGAKDERLGSADDWLAWTQDVLFNLGSELATPIEERWEGMPLVSDADAQALERAIDRAQQDLQPLANFIHPGGSQAGAALHIARTICRRAERLIVTLREQQAGVSPQTVRYVNRLSDALFVWARWVNSIAGVPEHLWNAKTKPPAWILKMPAWKP